MSEEELTKEQRKKIMGGWIAEKLGTGALDAMDEKSKSGKTTATSAKIYKKHHDAKSKELNGYANFYQPYKGITGIDPTKIWQ